ncbi:MAG: ribonuclease III [Ureaplasma sp.]|nr:ribonuclease III [Ureaplasma sp.]
MTENVNHKLLKKILTKYQINPKNYSVYIEALTHPTYANEKKLNYNYQRLEFLGDAAISWVVTNYLFKSNFSEAEMSLRKSNIVKGQTLAKIAREDFQLEDLVLKGNGLTVITDKILEDIFESFIGAIYRDQGIKKVQKILDTVLLQKVDNNSINLEKTNKTKFQECIMKNQKNAQNNENAIKYVHQYLDTKEWYVELIFDNHIYGKGIASKKKDAEELAAKEAMEKLALITDDNE